MKFFGKKDKNTDMGDASESFDDFDAGISAPAGAGKSGKLVPMVGGMAALAIVLGGGWYYMMGADDSGPSIPAKVSNSGAVISDNPASTAVTTGFDLPFPPEVVTVDGLDSGVPPQPGAVENAVSDFDGPEILGDDIALEAPAMPPGALDPDMAINDGAGVDGASANGVSANGTGIDDVLDANDLVVDAPADGEMLIPAELPEGAEAQDTAELIGPEEDFKVTPESDVVADDVKEDEEVSELIESWPGDDGMPETPPEENADVSGASEAELALIENMETLEQLGTPDATDKQRARLDDIKSSIVKDAEVRKLPPEYMILEKNADAEDYRSRMVAAKRLLKQGRYAAALDLFEGLYMDNQRDIRVLVGRAVSLQKLGDHSSAIEAYEEALEVNPKSLDALTNLLGLLRHESPDLALDKLSELRDSYPGNAGIAAQLGITYGSIGEYSKALRNIDVALGLDAQNPGYNFNKAVILDRMGRGAEAAYLYRYALQLDREAKNSTLPRASIEKRLAGIQ